MTPEQMKEKFNELFQLMASSNNVAFMRVFGNVHKEMMNWMIANKPDLAQDWVEKLCSIKWKNYLTTKEAEKIVSSMNPEAPWAMESWKQAMKSLGLVTEESPYYNSCALWVEMNKQYSDSANTIAAIKGVALNEVPAEDMVKATHLLALDMLKDADGKYNIRSYFGV
jgi:hypothetical protein